MPDQMDYDVLGAHKVAISGVAPCGGYPPSQCKATPIYSCVGRVPGSYMKCVPI